MRKTIMLLPFLIACSKSDAPQSGAADSTAAAAAAPAALTDADVSGTWQGTAKAAGSDSVFAHWTQICGGGTCKGTAKGRADTVMATYTLMADSAIGSSQPYMEPAASKEKVVDSWSLHIMNGKASGNGAVRLASKPDSVVMRYTFEGSRVP